MQLRLNRLHLARNRQRRLLLGPGRALCPILFPTLILSLPGGGLLLKQILLLLRRNSRSPGLSLSLFPRIPGLLPVYLPHLFDLSLMLLLLAFRALP